MSIGDDAAGLVFEDGKIIEWRFVSWYESHWEFGAPSVLHSPVLRYSSDGDSMEQMVEDACIDLCVDGKLEHIHPSDLREFEWRQWSIAGLPKRKNARHETCRVQLCLDHHGERSWRVLDQSTKEKAQ